MVKNFQQDIKKLITERVKMPELTAAQQDVIVRQLLDIISLKISMNVFDRLDDQGREKALKFLKSKDKSIFLNYLNTKIKDLPDLVEKNISESIEEFKRLSK